MDAGITLKPGDQMATVQQHSYLRGSCSPANPHLMLPPPLSTTMIGMLQVRQQQCLGPFQTFLSFPFTRHSWFIHFI